MTWDLPPRHRAHRGRELDTNARGWAPSRPAPAFLPGGNRDQVSRGECCTGSGVGTAAGDGRQARHWRQRGSCDLVNRLRTRTRSEPQQRQRTSARPSATTHSTSPATSATCQRNQTLSTSAGNKSISAAIAHTKTSAQTIEPSRQRSSILFISVLLLTRGETTSIARGQTAPPRRQTRGLTDLVIEPAEGHHGGTENTEARRVFCFEEVASGE